MNGAAELFEEIRRDLRPVTEQILRHPYPEALEAGRISREQVRLLAQEQYAIIRSDLRSVAHLVGRFGGMPSMDFFLQVLHGERIAWHALGAFARALGMDTEQLESYEPQPAAQTPASYLAWLALYGSDAEVAAAYLVSLPPFGENCGRLSQALRQHFVLSEAAVEFFDFFAASSTDFEKSALFAIEQGLARGVEPRLVRRSASMLQAYELLFWDSLLLTTLGE